MFLFKIKPLRTLAASLLCLFVGAVSAQNANGVYFISPKNGETVTSPFKVQFGIRGKGIGPLGDLDSQKGHHHLIVNGVSVNTGQSVPFNPQHLHFGNGQSETELNLPEGQHTLTLQFGDGAHRSFGPEWSSTISIKVVPQQKNATATLPSAW